MSDIKQYQEIKPPDHDLKIAIRRTRYLILPVLTLTLSGQLIPLTVWVLHGMISRNGNNLNLLKYPKKPVRLLLAPPILGN